MKETKEGHSFLLDSVGDNGLIRESQPIDFMEKIGGKMVMDGTTNEEVLKMMIHRMNYLQGKFPCRENALVITKLEESLMWLNKRTEKRVAQGVEGQDMAHK